METGSSGKGPPSVRPVTTQSPRATSLSADVCVPPPPKRARIWSYGSSTRSYPQRPESAGVAASPATHTHTLSPSRGAALPARDVLLEWPPVLCTCGFCLFLACLESMSLRRVCSHGPCALHLLLGRRDDGFNRQARPTPPPHYHSCSCLFLHDAPLFRHSPHWRATPAICFLDTSCSECCEILATGTSRARTLCAGTARLVPAARS